MSTSDDPKLLSLLANAQPGWTLAQPFYIDAGIFEAEQRAIWRTHWLFVGTVADVPEYGDFFTHTIGSDSVIIIRGPNGAIFAHHNTCRHRGSLVCLEKHGHAKALRCPYHQWVYDTDGTLLSARMMPDDFDKTRFGLQPISLEIVGGLIFICLAQAPPGFAEIRTAFGPYIAPFQLERSKVAHRERYELHTNWKLVAENFRECYHCGVAHPEYCRAVVGANLVENISDIVRMKRPQWQQKGLTTAQVNAPAPAYAVRYPLRDGFETYSLDGRPVSKPMGRHTDYDAGVVGLVLFPSFWMDAVSDHVWTMRVTPLAPDRTVIDVAWLIDEGAEEGRDYEIDRLCAFWRITGGQDWTLCENNFRGIASSGYRPGPYAPAESEVASFVEWYVARMRAACERDSVTSRLRPQAAK